MLIAVTGNMDEAKYKQIVQRRLQVGQTICSMSQKNNEPKCRAKTTKNSPSNLPKLEKFFMSEWKTMEDGNGQHS